MDLRPSRRGLALAALLLATASTLAASAQSAPRGTFAVKPVAPGTSTAGPKLALRTGRFFRYALPQGWRVGEDGQFALTLLAPDAKALTVMVGNAGVPMNVSPAQYAYQNLGALRPENLQLGPPRAAAPATGFQAAYAFDVSYFVGGVPCQGVATVHLTPAYDSMVMAMTAALSEARQWPGYATWLPLVAQQVAAIDGAAFGARGVMQQNLQASTAYGEAARRYREASAKLQQQVADGRGASVDRQNAQLRDTLGGVQSYVNPYDTRAPVQLPDTYKYYWVNAQGTYVGTNDPGVDPNAGSTAAWKRMPLQQP